MPELTNEMIAERLGWQRRNDSIWLKPGEDRVYRNPPDWLHDLNAAFPLLCDLEECDFAIGREFNEDGAVGMFDYSTDDTWQSGWRWYKTPAEFATAICRAWLAEQEAPHV